MDYRMLLILSAAAVLAVIITTNFDRHEKNSFGKQGTNPRGDCELAIYRMPRLLRTKRRKSKAVICAWDGTECAVHLKVIKNRLYISPDLKRGSSESTYTCRNSFIINKSDIVCFCGENEYVKYKTATGDEYCAGAEVRTAIWEENTGKMIRKTPVHFGRHSDTDKIKLYYMEDGEARSITFAASCRDTLSGLIPEKDVLPPDFINGGI